MKTMKFVISKCGLWGYKYRFRIYFHNGDLLAKSKRFNSYISCEDAISILTKEIEGREMVKIINLE